MDKTEIVRARVDPEVKCQVEDILGSLGLNLSDAIRIYFSKIILHNGLPFEVKNPNDEIHVSFLLERVIKNYSGEIRKLLKNLYEYSRNGGGTTESFAKWALIKLTFPNDSGYPYEKVKMILKNGSGEPEEWLNNIPIAVDQMGSSFKSKFGYS